MGEKEEKGARAPETDQSPRKALRLDPRCDAAETDKSPRDAPALEPTGSASPVGSVSMEDAASSDNGSGGCSHFHANGEETELLLVKIESLKYGGPPLACHCCVLESFGRRSAAGVSQEDQLLMVCSQCVRCWCAGVATKKEKPFGHAGLHAHDKRHFVALWLDQPKAGYCFFCEHEICIVASDVESSEGLSSVDGETMSSEMQPAGGHAHASGSDTDERGYVIRGIPNVANTCYLNAMVQCLLVLEKLRIRMLGPDTPTGSIGRALKELFEDTRARNDAGGMLNPWKLLTSVRALNSKYEDRRMHDSHELLCYLREGLNEEELKRHPNMREGVPTVVDSIFQGQLSTTLTSKCCQSDSVSHVPFYELALPMPSRGHPTKSVASPQWGRRSWWKAPAVKQLFPVIEECNSEKVQTIADGSDSHIPDTELEYVAIEPEPLEVDSTEAEQPQKKSVVHGPLLTREDEVLSSQLSQEIIEVPEKSVAFLPDSVFNIKVEEMHKTMADSHSPEDTDLPPLVSPVREKNASMASGSDVEKQDNAGVSDLLNQPEVTSEARSSHSMASSSDAEVKGKTLGRDVVHDEKVGDSNSLASVKDCLALFFKEEVLERRCENCSKVSEQPSTTRSKDGGPMVENTDENTSVDRDQAEPSDRKAGQNEQSSDLNSSVVKCISSSRQPYDSDAQLQVIHTQGRITEAIGLSIPEKDSASSSTANKESDCYGKTEEKVDLLSVQDSQNASITNQDSRKQIDLNSARQVGENRNEQEDRSGHADKKVVISKLPPVFTVQLMRFYRENNLDIKETGHVSFEANLDLGQFVDLRTEDKDNARYGLVGVLEHIGSSTMVGHYVAYVRGSNIGSHQQLSSGSSSWFCANDDNIREVSLEEVLKREAFILFYERMEG